MWVVLLAENNIIEHCRKDFDFGGFHRNSGSTGSGSRRLAWLLWAESLFCNQCKQSKLKLNVVCYRWVDMLLLVGKTEVYQSVNDE